MSLRFILFHLNLKLIKPGKNNKLIFNPIPENGIVKIQNKIYFKQDISLEYNPSDGDFPRCIQLTDA